MRRTKNGVAVSLRGRLLLLVAAALLPVAGLIVVGELRERGERLNGDVTRAAQLANLIAVQQSGFLENTDQLLAAMAAAPEIRAEDPTACRGYLKRVHALQPQFSAFFVLDAQGTARCATIDFPPGLHARDRSYFQDARRTVNLVIGRFIVAKLTGVHLLPLARRIPGPNGAFAGAIVASVTLDWLSGLAERAKLEPGAKLLLADKDGVLLASSDPAYRDRLGHRLTWAARFTGTRAPATLFVDQRAVGVAPVGDGALYYMVDLPRGQVAAANRRFATELVLAALVVAVAFVAAWALGEFAVARRLGRLVTAVERLRAGAPGARANERGRDEIALLAESFNHLADEIERRQAALEEHAEVLAGRNAELARFTYIASHDLRAPLVNIQGFTKELRLSVDELLAAVNGHNDAAAASGREDIDEALDFIESAVGRMDRLIAGVLQLSRVGQRALQQEEVALTPLLDQIVRSAQHQIKAAGATLQVDALPTVLGDRLALEQVFANLIDNALKYGQGDRAPEIAVRATVAGETVAVAVRDNGRGFAPDEAERVFEMFQRVGRNDQPGEGMGLAYARTLVRRLGGEITADATPGGGARFVVTLPLAETVAAAA